MSPGLYTCECGAPLMTYQEVWQGTCGNCLAINILIEDYYSTLNPEEEQQ